MSFDNEVSPPEFLYTPMGSGLGRVLQLPRPQRFETKPRYQRNRNRSDSGNVETLLYFDVDLISIGWDLLGVTDCAGIRKLFDGTADGRSFTFRRHRLHGGAYPNAVDPIHDNSWVVKWADGFDELPFQLNDGIKDRWDIDLKMERIV